MEIGLDWYKIPSLNYHPRNLCLFSAWERNMFNLSRKVDNMSSKTNIFCQVTENRYNDKRAYLLLHTCNMLFNFLILYNSNCSQMLLLACFISAACFIYTNRSWDISHCVEIVVFKEMLYNKCNLLAPYGCFILSVKYCIYKIVTAAVWLLHWKIKTAHHPYRIYSLLYNSHNHSFWIALQLF